MEETNETPNVTRSFKVSGMPMREYLRWKKSAIEEFGDCHWLKCINDHKAASFVETLNALWGKIAELEYRIESLLEEPKEEREKEKTKVKTFGGSE
jgi:hypothetical protein